MDDNKLAVLIDAENAQASVLPGIIEEISKLGVATSRRIYGDFTTPNLKPWTAILRDYAIQPVQQFCNTSGKNASDSALIIDAMDMLHSKRFDGFCIVSSDSDFTRLANRLREDGLAVFGFGEKKTPKAFVSACNRFIYTEILRSTSAGGPVTARQTTPVPDDLLSSAVEESLGDDGWAKLATVGNLLSKRAPDFDSRNYGHPKLASLMEALEGFEVRRPKSGTGVVYVRPKPRPA